MTALRSTGLWRWCIMLMSGCILNEYVTRVLGRLGIRGSCGMDVWVHGVMGGRVPFQIHRVCLDFSLVCLRLLDGRLLLE